MADEIRNTQANDSAVDQTTETTATETAPDTTANETGGGENTPTVEELMAQLAKERKERKLAEQKSKATIDKLTKANGDLTKENRSYKTQSQLDMEELNSKRDEQEAELNELREYRHRNEAKERYLLQGMNPELATKAAEAEVGGDMDALADIQKQHTDALIKAKEKEWKASRPQLNAGSGSGSGMSKDEIMAIKDAGERRKAIASNLEAFT